LVKRAPISTARQAVALRFKTEIEQAASQGVTLEDMTLHLTLRDMEQLKRDRTLPIADISFAGGTMKYLGVKILKGDGSLSVLHLRVTDAV
jgi:hypothetical protein